MSTFNITLVSPDKASLKEIARFLKEENEANEVVTVEGGLGQWAATPPQEAPGALVLDPADDGAADLETLERLNGLYPQMGLIMLSENQSPDFLLRAMRAGVREVLASPVRPEDLKAAVERIRRKKGSQSDMEGKILAFVSCKGGSGATFIAANLGFALAASQKKRVALLDLNLEFGDASLLVSEQRPGSTLSDVTRQIHRLDNAFLTASMINVMPNFAVLPAPEDFVQTSDIKPEHVDSLLRLARKHYDYVIVDLGRSLDGVTVKALDLADMIFPVLQITLPFIRDGKRLLDVFLRSLDYPKSKIHLIVNRYQRRGEIRLQDLEKALGLKVFRTIPNSYQAVAASVNHAVPIAKLARRNPVAKSLREMSQFLTHAPGNNSRRGWFSRAFAWG